MLCYGYNVAGQLLEKKKTKKKKLSLCLYPSVFSCPTPHSVSAVSQDVLCNEWESSPDLTVAVQ